MKPLDPYLRKQYGCITHYDVFRMFREWFGKYGSDYLRKKAGEMHREIMITYKERGDY
jgi:hypothetical protein